MIKLVRTTLVAVALTAIVAGSASAQEVTNVTTEVQTLEAMNLDNKASTVSLVINSIDAGQATASKTDSTSHTFDISTNKTNTKVSAAFTGTGASNLPAGLTLAIKIGNGTAANITTTAAELLSLTQTSLNDAKVYYTLTADVSAGVVAATTKEITYTLTAGT